MAASRDWLLAVLDATERRPASRIGLEQVDVIREAFAGFQEADVMRDVGHARQPLAEYLTSRVLPLLQDVDPHSEAGGALFAAASEQTYLLGWMAIDDDRQALAQRYLIQALRLSQESGDTALGAHVLAGMSDQARMLGYPREALQLAITGRHGLARAYNPACAARLFTLQARAHAALGEQNKPHMLWSSPNTPSSTLMLARNQNGRGLSTMPIFRVSTRRHSVIWAAPWSRHDSPDT